MRLATTLTWTTRLATCAALAACGGATNSLEQDAGATDAVDDIKQLTGEDADDVSLVPDNDASSDCNGPHSCASEQTCDAGSCAWQSSLPDGDASSGASQSSPSDHGDVSSAGSSFQILEPLSASDAGLLAQPNWKYNTLLRFKWNPLQNEAFAGPNGSPIAGLSVINSDTDAGPGANTVNIEPFWWTAATGSLALGVMSNSGIAPWLSSDGSTVVAQFIDGAQLMHILRWTKPSGLVDLGEIGSNAEIEAVSPDGQTITISVLDLRKNFLQWSAATGWVHVIDGATEDYPGSLVNEDGSVIVGRIFDEGGPGTHLFQWTKASGMTAPTVPAGVCTWQAMTPDGTALVVYCVDSQSLTGTSYRWTQASGFVDMGALSAGTCVSGDKISADGSTVTGTSSVCTEFLTKAFYWTANSGIVALDRPNGRRFDISNLSADGRVLAGRDGPVVPTGGTDTYQAYRWTLATGFVPFDLLPGDSQNQASVTSDGTIGYGWSEHAGAVIWDAKGARAVAAELSAGGVDLKGLHLDDVVGAWVGSEITGLGEGTLPNGTQRLWVAHLPLRP
jgi:hypothetical protein